MTNLTLGGLSVARIDDKQLEFSFHNGLGHLMATVESNAEMSTGFVYGPFGEILSESGDVETHFRRFNSKEADQLSRLNYYGYRYYDPLSLTWTQADPLYRIAPDLAYDQPRKMSLYAFSGNNPMRYVDPDGRSFFGALGSYVKGVGKGILNTVKHPIETAEKIKKATVKGAELAGEGAAKAYIVLSSESTQSQINSVSDDDVAGESFNMIEEAAVHGDIDATMDSVGQAVGEGTVLSGAGTVVKGLAGRGVKVKGGRKVKDTVSGSNKIRNTKGEVFKRVDYAPSKPHNGMLPHTHPNFRNTLPDGSVRSGTSSGVIDVNRSDIIDAARAGGQRTGN